jgi:alpha-ketoglutarate-dependent taurine dioxygenase
MDAFSPVREGFLSEGQRLPLVLEPACGDVDLAEWVRGNREHVENQLSLHGGILFRGFGLTTPQEFEHAASAICTELFEEYGDLPREDLGGKVYTSTPYPENKSILYHNESSHLSSWPAKINFFCITVAQAGGATPIADCRSVYQDLDPEVRRKFTELGLLYVRNFCEGLDVSWQRFFGTDDRQAIEAACNRRGMTCEWTASGGLRTKQRCAAVMQHPKTGEMSFFNQVQLHHVHCLDPEVRESLLAIFVPEDMPRQVYYGDGSAIEDSVMDHVGEIYEKHAVRFQWKEGDMITLDNMLTAHARDPYTGPRKIIVALGDMVYGRAR